MTHQGSIDNLIARFKKLKDSSDIPSVSNVKAGYLEEDYLFPYNLPQHFTQEECILIQQAYDRFMDGGFLIWPKRLDINIFITILSKLHPNIKFTVDRGNVHND